MARLVACGKLFESTFGISYGSGVWIGGAITLVYTLMGGYLAVCWTDVFQGMLMALVVWKQIGLGDKMHEIVPGFLANSATMLLIDRIACQKDAAVLQQFDEVGREVRNARARTPQWKPVCDAPGESTRGNEER